ncbi:MAG TPA: hypothetical protein VHR39_21230 [Propionibacteriaceae bacterium]|jgi:hypothetical protein|nr:hypothetical protein [Propionibacteriaceae bacterium]
MVLPSEDDRDAIDRAFAELVAGYHLTADPPDAFTNEPPTEPITSIPDAADGAPNWAIDHPLFGFVETPADALASSGEPSQDRYVPEPLPPLGRPGMPALLGWIGIGYAIIIVLAATFGLRFPAWTGWIAVGSFVGGFGILMTRLPRDRPPDAGDGAVL